MTLRHLLTPVLDALSRLDPSRRRRDLHWWERRVRRRGAASVYHAAHRPEELEEVDRWQKEILYPIFQAQLRGDERVVLDFGCGPGRFTPDLARLVGGRAVGVDPIRSLLDLAPPGDAVEYRPLYGGRIPLGDRSVDVVWICLVLTCITDERALDDAVAEVRRVLRDDGLLFLVENTEPKERRPHIAFRSVEEYRALFPCAALEHVHDYHDRGERISVLAGRKAGAAPDG